MSQKSTPRSPKSPRSKSPSCEDVEGDQGEQVFDELQRAVEEELRSSDRILSEVRNSIAGSKGRNAQSRSSYQQSASRPASRIPSPRAASTCEDDNPRLPSPPVSPVTYGSRGVTPGVSQRGSRVPSPEYSGTKTYSVGSHIQNADAQEDYCPDENEPYKYASMHSQGRGTPTSRSATPTSKLGSVTFGNKPSGASYSSQARYGNEAGTSVAGLNAGGRDMNTSALRMNASNADAGTSCLRMGQSYADAAVSHLKMGPSQADTGTSCLRMGQSYTDTATSNLRMGPSQADTGTSCLRMGSSYVVEAPASRMGASRMDMDRSGMGLFGAEVGTSAMTYKTSKDRPSTFSGSNCSPGCRKFMKEIEENQPFSSTPLNQEGPRAQPLQTTYTVAKPLTSCPHAGGKRCGSPGATAGHQMAPTEFGHRQYYGHQGASNFDRSSPAKHETHAKFQQNGGGLHQHHFDEGAERSPVRDEKVVSVLSHLSQLRKTPSYYRCGFSQGMDFLKVCCPKLNDGSKSIPAKFPEIPCLRQEELEELIKCETQDVDSAWYIMSDERKTYKKPCPKQQKAQMTVKALMQTHAGQICSQKEYFPLEHPDPEDISPEVAASMMFSQERGVKMEECPNDTITSLFPDEPKSPFPEKIPASSISIVDRSSKDQEEMIEKSASVPSEGVSDSAYTRTMKGKGEEIGPQKSFDVDFAIGQSKREYILVAQKPQRVNKVQYRGNTPPWFPGFFSAFPDDDGLKMVNSPSGLFHKAWFHSNPGNMPTSDVIVLD